MKFIAIVSALLVSVVGKKVKFSFKLHTCGLRFIVLNSLAKPTSDLILPRFPISVLTSGKFAGIPQDKIVGGTEVVPNSLPFQVSLQRRGILPNSAYSHICGGSILDDHTILDAAHCVDG